MSIAARSRSFIRILKTLLREPLVLFLPIGVVYISNGQEIIEFGPNPPGSDQFGQKYPIFI
jgi:hypothetical protein